MDVSDQILQQHLLYGGSDNTNADWRCIVSINYAHGTSIHSPIEVSFSSYPLHNEVQRLRWSNGCREYFHKVNLNIDSVNGCLEDEGYEC